MKKIQPARATSTREAFEYKLTGYSAIGAAVLATGAAVASAATAAAQTNITAASFGGTLPSATFLTEQNFLIAGFNAKIAIRGTDSFRSAYIGGLGFKAAFSGPAPEYGDLVNLSGSWGQPAVLLVSSQSSSSSGSGSSRRGIFTSAAFGNPAQGYLAFRKSGTYGWLRVQVSVNPQGKVSMIELYDDGSGIVGAYQPGSITVGQTFTAVPEPASVATGLGLFALGAAGVREFRRRRKLVA